MFKTVASRATRRKISDTELLLGKEMPNEDLPKDAPTPDTSVQFSYLKSTHYRVVHCDGVTGGLTPRLNLQLNFWNERPPIPKSVSHEINADGSLGKEIRSKRKSRKGVVREVEVGVVMDMEAAIVFRNWLDGKIKEAEALITQIPPETK